MLRRHLPLALSAMLLASAAQARVVETRTQVPVQVTDRAGQVVQRALQVTVFRDDARRGALPLAVISHGRPATRAGQTGMGRAHYGAAARYLAQKGYVVAVPTRIGYGVTGGADVEASGNCDRREYGPGFRAAATQILAVVDAVQQQPQVRRDGTLLVGHSYGAIASLEAAAMRPKGVAAVINFSGGAGADPVARPGQPCSTFPLAQQLRQQGLHNRMPTLWLYAPNDRYLGQEVPRQWFAAYTRIGGVGEFVQTRAVGQDGHTLFTHFPSVWQPQVNRFLNRLPAASRP